MGFVGDHMPVFSSKISAELSIREIEVTPIHLLIPILSTEGYSKLNAVDRCADRKQNVRELTSAVSRINYLVEPYKLPGQSVPSPSAIEKAELVASRNCS
jgi:hypothetical protein